MPSSIGHCEIKNSETQIAKMERQESPKGTHAQNTNEYSQRLEKHEPAHASHVYLGDNKIYSN
jgi:hypothetical protein